MGPTAFQRQVDINSNSYNRFMKFSGPASGIDNETYLAAHRFFLDRELKGIAPPKPKKAKKEDLDKFDVSDIHLDGEADDSVPVFDTCDDVRTKIRAHLRQPGMTQAALAREMSKCFADGRTVHGKTIADFLKKKGPTAGNTSGAYYGAYVYFEKLRVKKGGKKTKKRTEMEALHLGGMDTTRPSNWGFLCRADERPYADNYGVLSFH